jgi:hypothetical protein
MLQIVRKERPCVTINFAWQGKYTEALLELDREKLPLRIEIAEKAIFQRIEELKQNKADSADELWAINDALRGLQVLAKSECAGQCPPKAGVPQGEVAL